MVEVRDNDVTIVRYAYDPMGRRIWRGTPDASTQQTWFLFADEGLFAELDSNGEPIIEYGWIPESHWGTELIWQRTESRSFIGHNAAPFVSEVLTDTNGVVAWEGVRESFGRLMDDQNATVINRLRLPGQWGDSVAGLFDNWNRMFNPAIGRYMSRDILPVESGEFTYAYANSNPINAIDNLGLFASMVVNVHERISTLAFSAVGFDQRCHPTIATAAIHWSWAYDFEDGSQLLRNAYTHAMTPYKGDRWGRGITASAAKNSARLEWGAFIEKNISICRAHEVGKALHAAQDAHARYHVGFQFWDGGWPHLVPGFPGVGHTWSDTFPSGGEFMGAFAASTGVILRFLSRCKIQCGCYP